MNLLVLIVLKNSICISEFSFSVVAVKSNSHISIRTSFPLVRSIRNYSLADLHHQYKKYIHKRPKHILF